MELKEKIKSLANQYFTLVQNYRRYLHRYPELSGKEEKTAAFIVDVLKSLNIPFRDKIAGFGIVALIKGDLPGEKTVALRADMDALPLQEKGTSHYRSENNGVMHACGHDVHMACLLGTVHILNELRPFFGGNVKVVFQPSEEQYEGGAPFMIKEGVLENPKVDVIFAQHVTPELKTGTIGLKSDAFMASTDEIYIEVTGKGGHAALIEELVNPIFVGLEILHELQYYFEKNKPCTFPSVLSFGRFIANGLTNLVPDTASIAGTLRTFDERWRSSMLSKIEEIAQHVSAKYKASCIVDIKRGYPVLVNNKDVAMRLKTYAEDYFEEHNVHDLSYRMTAEDFSYYLQKIPGVLFRLGTTAKDVSTYYPLHSDQFDIDEKALESGMGFLSWLALNELNNVT